MEDDIATFNEDDNKGRQFVYVLAREMAVLRCFRPGEVFLSHGNAPLAKCNAIPKPSIARLPYTLTKLGYFHYSESQGQHQYQLGAGVPALGYRMLNTPELRQLARPLMAELAHYAQAAVSLGTRERHSMVYVETCRRANATACWAKCASANRNTGRASTLAWNGVSGITRGAAPACRPANGRLTCMQAACR